MKSVRSKSHIDEIEVSNSQSLETMGTKRQRKRETLARSVSSKEDYPADLLQIYEHKAKELIRTLTRIPKQYSNYDDAEKAWKKQCSRYVVCHSMSIKPIHRIGQIMVENGQFYVAYHQMLSLSRHYLKSTKSDMVAKYRSKLTKAQQAFDAQFGTSTSKPVKIQVYNSKPKKIISKSKQQIEAVRESVMKERSAVVRPVNMDTNCKKIKQQRYLTFEEYCQKTGYTPPPPSVRPVKKKSSGYILENKYSFAIPDRVREIIDEAGVMVAYKFNMFELVIGIQRNYHERDVFAVCVIQVTNCTTFTPAPMVSIIPLDRFEEATANDIAAMRGFEVRAFLSLTQEERRQILDNKFIWPRS